MSCKEQQLEDNRMYGIMNYDIDWFVQEYTGLQEWLVIIDLYDSKS